MITVTKTKRGELPAVFFLYRSAFPQFERKPFGRITGMVNAGRADLWTIRRNGRFAGFAATVNAPGLVLLDYFAVKGSLRGKGVGSDALKVLMEHYRDRGFFVEIESTREDAPNRMEREKRKKFYVNCGLIPMGTEADLFGVRMELLGVGCHLDLTQYRSFYHDHYSPWAAEHIHPVKEEP